MLIPTEYLELHHRRPELVRLANELVGELLKEQARQARRNKDVARKRKNDNENEKTPQVIPLKNQWQNLRAAAVTSSCIEELEGYIRYQGSRSTNRWDSFLVNGLLARLPVAAGSQGMPAIRYFVGYLVRAVAPHLPKRDHRSSSG